MTYFVDDIVIYLKKKKDNKQLLYKLALIWKHFKRVSYVAEVWKLNIPKHFFFFFFFFLGWSPNAGLAVTPPVKPQLHRAWAALWLFDFIFFFNDWAYAPMTPDCDGCWGLFSYREVLKRISVSKKDPRCFSFVRTCCMLQDLFVLYQNDHTANRGGCERPATVWETWQTCVPVLFREALVFVSELGSRCSCVSV